MLNCVNSDGQAPARCTMVPECTYLENDVFFVDVLDSGDNVFSFALGQRNRLGTASQNWAIGLQFGYSLKLSGVQGLYSISGCRLGIVDLRQR